MSGAVAVRRKWGIGVLRLPAGSGIRGFECFLDLREAGVGFGDPSGVFGYFWDPRFLLKASWRRRLRVSAMRSAQVGHVMRGNGVLSS